MADETQVTKYVTLDTLKSYDGKLKPWVKDKIDSGIESISLVESAGTGNILKKYTLKYTDFNKQEHTFGDIDIPKDFLVKSGSVVVLDAEAAAAANVEPGTYIKLVLNVKDGDEVEDGGTVYIPVAALYSDYTAEQGAKQVQLTIDDNHVISAVVVEKSITVKELGDEAVETEKIKDGAVLTDKIADANITAVKLATDSVETEKIKAEAVTEAKLATNSVVTGKIKDGAVLTDKIADANVTTAKIAIGAVTGGVSVGGVATGSIAEETIVNGNLVDKTIESGKIADSAIITDKIADGNVTTGKIADANVTAVKLAIDAVTTEKILAKNVTNEKIADATIARAKISSEFEAQIAALETFKNSGTNTTTDIIDDFDWN